MSENQQPDVGYGCPPKEHQFKPGQSGNPRGRPKGRKGLGAIVQALANKKVSIVENGKRRSVTKIEIAVTQLINKAASGSERAIAQFLALMQMSDAPTTPVGFDSANDEALMKSLTARLRQTLDDTEGEI